MGKYLKYIKRQWANISFTRKTDVVLQQPVVSFTFDDVPVSAFTNGARILSGHNFSGTFYLSLGLMNGADPATRFTVAQIKDALVQKHEMGCHTFSHTDLHDTPFSAGSADILKNKEAAQSLLPDLTFRNFSYPFGSQTRAIKMFLSRQYRSARGIGEGINTRNTDIYNLKTVKLYEKRHTPDYIFAKIKEASECGGWLILYTHDVQDNPSEYGCSPAYLEAVAQKCAEEKIKVLTINEALNLIENSTHES